MGGEGGEGGTALETLPDELGNWELGCFTTCNDLRRRCVFVREKTRGEMTNELAARRSNPRDVSPGGSWAPGLLGERDHIRFTPPNPALLPPRPRNILHSYVGTSRGGKKGSRGAFESPRAQSVS